MRRSEAASRLKTMAPNERRNEVARALVACLKDPNPFAQKEVVEALDTWATKESVPALLEALATPDPFARKAIFKVLTHFPDDHVCEVLAKHLEVFNDRAEAAAALRTIGPMAEKAVLKRLHHSEVFLRQEVCKILAAIGTKESLPALKDVVAEGEFFTKDDAQRAIKAIQARQKAGK
jgi:HEAT repeat protein